MNLTALRNRRLTKGVIVGAAGLALLLGGGTYALWFDNADIPGGTINSGELDIALVGAGVWHENTCVGPPIAVISTYLISPNDVVCFTQAMTVAVKGAAIAATFAVDTSDIDGEGVLIDNVDITSSLTPATGFTAVALPAVHTWTVAPLATAYPITVSVTFTFDASTTAQIAQLDSIDLTSIAFSLVQTPGT